MLEAERLQRGKLACRYENNVAALTAVTAVGSAVCNVLLCMERAHSGPAVARLNIYLRVIYKHKYLLKSNKEKCLPKIDSTGS